MSTVPNWLVGLWKRLSIETADGYRDTETQVFYLQTPICYGDLRIPLDRPDLKQASFLTLTQRDFIALSKQQGFSGVAEFEEGYCRWVRYIDYQPPQVIEDIGLLHWEDDLLIEEGVEQSYREEWQKIDDGDGDYTALILTYNHEPYLTANWKASLVIAGDYFIYTHNRVIPLPLVASLTDCLQSSTDSQKRIDYLSCEISFGLCCSGQFPWEIQRSTFPWREGSPLWSKSDLTVDLENRRVLQSVPQKVFSETFPEIQEWQIIDWGTGKAFEN